MQWQSLTMLPKSHSLKRRSSSSAPSGPISYGFDRIKLHQVQVMSPVLLVHLSLPSTTQVLEGIIQSFAELLSRRRESNSAKDSCCLHDRKRNARLQDNATHAKPGCCETKSFFVRWKAWKRPAQWHGSQCTPPACGFLKLCSSSSGWCSVDEEGIMSYRSIMGKPPSGGQDRRTRRQKSRWSKWQGQGSKNRSRGQKNWFGTSKNLGGPKTRGQKNMVGVEKKLVG